MENRDNQNPSTGSESDISKSQSQQQPTGSQGNQQQSGNQAGSEQSGDQAATGQSQSDQTSGAQSGFGETATQQRSDVEGSSLGQQPTGAAESGFVGSEGQSDTSSELVEDEDQDFSKDGQGAPEGK
jgi:hypothetical protein